MIQTLTLNAVLNVARPPWLFARTYRVLNRAALIVIKSPIMRDSYSAYQEVLEFVGNYRLELAWKGSLLSGELMFQEGDIHFYLEAVDGGECLDLDPELIDELRREGLRIVNETAETA